MSAQLNIPLAKSTFVYGDLFEHFIILQCKLLADYFHEDYRFSYLRTKDDVEVDLIVERPGLPILFIEIKSTDCVEERHLSTLVQLKKDFGECELVCLSNDKYRKKIGDVMVYPWREGLALFS